MPALVPAIHVLQQYATKDVDGRNKSGHDDQAAEYKKRPAEDGK
jgi:hypothetical protein